MSVADLTSRIGATVTRGLFRYGWDIRSRNLPPARLIRDLVRTLPRARSSVLDVGCGRFGLAAFLEPGMVTGADVDGPDPARPREPFVRASIAALPFSDRTYPVVASVDVLEHLPSDVRSRAIAELVRVADRAVVIACPHGATAQQCDEAYRRGCEARGRPLPAWLVEHQRQPYPETSEIVRELRAAAAESGREAHISVSHSERADVCRLVRAAATRSDLVYMALNLSFGLLFDALPVPGAATSYRTVVVATLAPSLAIDGPHNGQRSTDTTAAT